MNGFIYARMGQKEKNNSLHRPFMWVGRGTSVLLSSSHWIPLTQVILNDPLPWEVSEITLPSGQPLSCSKLLNPVLDLIGADPFWVKQIAGHFRWILTVDQGHGLDRLKPTSSPTYQPGDPSDGPNVCGLDGHIVVVHPFCGSDHHDALWLRGFVGPHIGLWGQRLQFQRSHPLVSWWIGLEVT